MFTKSLALVAALLFGVVLSNAGYCDDMQVQTICDQTGCHTVTVITYGDEDEE